jgi:hypothetical protein
VPTEVVPPVTVVGFRVTDDTSGGLTVIVAEAFRVVYAAEISDVDEVPTALVETVKVAVFEPAGTVTLGSTVATAVLLLVSVTKAPPAPAGDPSVIVPVEVFVPTTLVGFRPTAKGVKTTVRVACAEVLL